MRAPISAESYKTSNASTAYLQRLQCKMDGHKENSGRPFLCSSMLVILPRDSKTAEFQRFGILKPKRLTSGTGPKSYSFNMNRTPDH